MRTNSYLLNLILGLVFVVGQVQSDPDPLQDYCVADTQNQHNFFCNGAPCINPALAKSTHFATSALSKPGNTRNQFGFNVTLTNTMNLPGLNTLGLAMARVDIAATGIVPPHSHPRASEVVVLLKGSLLVGFADTSSRLFTQQLRPGDCFVFPKGMIHFLYNVDSNNAALAVSGLSSQNPGLQMASTATLTSTPPLPNEVLERCFQINGHDLTKIIRNLGG